MSKKLRLVYKKGNNTYFGDVVSFNIKRDGARGIDYANFEVPSKYDIKQNDIVKLIADDVDTTFLTGVYNFQGSFRDESGINELHGSGTAGFETPKNGVNLYKYKANYAAKFDSAGDEITVADDTVLDFTKQFDIIISFTMNSNNINNHFNGSSNTTQILFSKHDGTHGVEIGIKYVNGVWRVYAKVDSTELEGDETLFNISTNVGYIAQTVSRTIRLYRNYLSEVRLSLDNLLDGNDCLKGVSTHNNRNTSPMYIGTSYLNVNGTTTNNYDYHGLIHQIRIYCGGYLRDDDVETLLTYAPQPFLLKFSGRVRKIQDGLDLKKIECFSESKPVLTSIANSSLLSGTVTTPTTNEPATHEYNVFDDGQTTRNILQTIIYNTDSDVIWRNGTGATGSATTLQGDYLAGGTVVQNLQTLSIYDNKTFVIFPTRTFIYEKNDGVDTDYEFDYNRYIITSRSKTDLKLINDVEVEGTITNVYEKDTGNNANGATNNNQITFTLSAPPRDLKIYDSSNNFVYDTDYKVRPYKKQIIFYGNNNNAVDYTSLTFEYTREKDDTETPYKRNSDATSISTFGRFSKKLIIPQFTTKNECNIFGQKLLNLYETPQDLYTIKAPFLINSIRENHNIVLYNPKMKFVDTNGSETDTITVNVKGIEWRYPQNETIITCGQYDFDAYEIEQGKVNDISNLNISKTLNQNL